MLYFSHRHDPNKMVTMHSLSALLILFSFLLAGCGSPPKSKEISETQQTLLVQETVPSQDEKSSPGIIEAEEPEQSSPAPAIYKTHMVVAGNQLASEAGLEVLRKGGNAIDAAIATEMVLGLVEPQSSGIGGGAFMLYHDTKTGAIAAYDGRETAPASASPEMFLKADGTKKSFYDAVVGGSAVGAPGLMRMFELAHKKYGKLPWKSLFTSAIKLAETGFNISPRLAMLLAKDKYLPLNPVTARYFYLSDGTAKPEGALLKNPEYAQSLKLIAEGGADAFYQGEIARDIVNTVQNANQNPSGMTVSDLSGYKAILRAPVCAPYRRWLVCGMGPPSSGGLTTLQILGILENFDLSKNDITSAETVHLIAEAGALAFADRNVYIADPDFIPVPGGLINSNYLKSRAQEIDLNKSGGKRYPGMPSAQFSEITYGPHTSREGLSTTHMSIVDRDGNTVSMTASIENAFGSRLMTRGFLLNNQLTDFSFNPTAGGSPVANAAAPGKRPRSSMSPTLVFDDQSRLVMAIGSPGGSGIIGYVTKTILAVLDGKMDMSSAVALPNMLNRNGKTDLEKGTALEDLVPALEAKGHTTRLFTWVSGLNGIRVTPEGLDGGADPRREGFVAAD